MIIKDDLMWWSGSLGREYEYRIYKIGHKFERMPGNYIFAKQTPQNSWIPVFVGQTHDLSYTLNEELVNHLQLVCIQTEGATHILAHTNIGLHEREDEVRDLVAIWAPSCNE